MPGTKQAVKEARPAERRPSVILVGPPGAPGGGGGGDLCTLAPAEDLVKIFECPVCNEVLLPPIYQCITGHPICKSCRPKLNQCYMCQANYTNSRNYPMEAIVATSKFFCTYRESGCPVALTGSYLQHHIDECQFRPLTCPYTQVDGCRNSMLNMKNFLTHLHSVHKFQPPVAPTSTTNTFVFNFTYDNWRNPVNYSSWKGRLVRFDGHIFLSRSFSCGSMFYFSLVLIGESTIASKYLFKITIRKYSGAGSSRGPAATKGNGVQSMYQVIFPVGSIRNLKVGSENKSDFLQGKIHYATVSKSVLDLYGRITPTTPGNPNRANRFEWENEYQIIKTTS